MTFVNQDVRFKYERFNQVGNNGHGRARGLFDCDHTDRTRSNAAKFIVIHFNTSVAQHFRPNKITTTWNALPNEVVSIRTVNSFKNSLYKHWAENTHAVNSVISIITIFIRKNIINSSYRERAKLSFEDRAKYFIHVHVLVNKIICRLFELFDELSSAIPKRVI